MSSCFQVSVNTHYFNYMMISTERVCKQPERRQRLHIGEALCTGLPFTFFFQDELYFPKAHQQGQGPCSCNPDFRENYPLSLRFPSCPHLLPGIPSSGFLYPPPYKAGQFFILNPGFSFQDLKMSWKHCPRCAGPESFAAVKLRSDCPLVSILLHSKAETCLPVSEASVQILSSPWKVLVKIC